MTYFISRGLRIPLHSNIANLGVTAFDRLSLLIDELPQNSREKEKIDLLAGCDPYLRFVAALTGSTTPQIQQVLEELKADDFFFTEFQSRLEPTQNMGSVGDMRFHATTLYLVCRLKVPKVVVETGVAAGKSSAMLLLAILHNGSGKLVSFDLPANGTVADDGSDTSLEGREIGWLVPDYLRQDWDLRVEDSLTGLKKLEHETWFRELDIFLHDSLHTYEHAKAEFECVLANRQRDLLVLCDNIDLGCGSALNEILNGRKIDGFGFRDFAGALIPGEHH